MDSRPATPTAVAKSRAHIFSLDAISRNLFNSRPGSSRGDIFGMSIGSHHRTKSSASRSSTHTQTTTTADGSLAKFSYRSGSTNTAATSLMSGDEESSANKSFTSHRKLVKRGRSPGSGRSSPQPVSRSSSGEHRDDDDDEVDKQLLDRSDPDLSMRLELARRNSQSQHGKYVHVPMMETTVEDTIYEGMISSLLWHRIITIVSAEEPPPQLRPISRASTAKENSLSGSRQASSSPARGLPMPSQLDIPRPAEPRLFGPRSPSPHPPPSPVTMARQELPSTDVGVEDESLFFQDFEESTLEDATPSPLPRSKRQTFGPFNIESTPKAMNGTNGVATPFSNIEPLSIKKKSSTRSGHSPYTPTRKHRTSPLSKTTGRIISPRRVSPQTSKPSRPSFSHLTAEYTDNILQVMASARDEV